MDNNNSKSFLSISFAKGFVAPNIPIATFTQGGTKLNFIIDTGSDDSVIDQKILKSLQYEPTNETKTLTCTNGVVEDIKTCKVPIQFEDEEFQILCLIHDLTKPFEILREGYGIPLHGMIGSKFLRENNITLDFNSLTAYNKKA